MANNLTPGGHTPTGYRIKKDLIPDDAPIKLCNNNYTEAVLAEEYVDLADLLINQRSKDYYIKLDRYKKVAASNYFAVNYKSSRTSDPLIIPWEHTLAIPYTNGNSSILPYYTEFVMAGSRPTFNKLIAFCGNGEKNNAKDVEIFSYSESNSIQISRSASGFCFSYTDLSGSSQTINMWNNGQDIIPTCLFVQLQAEGGKGGTAKQTSGGCGGGAGDCQFVVLDWTAALKYIKSNESSSFTNINNISFKIKTSPRSGYGASLELYIWYKLPTEVTKNSLLLTIYGGSNGPTKTYTLGGARGQDYKLESNNLNTAGKIITVLDLQEPGKPNYYGYGGIPSYRDFTGTTYDGYNSITGYYSNTIRPTLYYPAGYKYDITENSGGTCGTPYYNYGDGGGGGGASMCGNGGSGAQGGTAFPAGAGCRGSGGGGAAGVSYGSYGNPGNGGCAYICFYSDAFVSKVNYITLTITHNSSYQEASASTDIAYLQENGNSDNIVKIYPSTTNLSYPANCDESNTLFCYQSGGYTQSVKMSEVVLNKTYTASNGSYPPASRWGYDIVFTLK